MPMPIPPATASPLDTTPNATLSKKDALDKKDAISQFSALFAKEMLKPLVENSFSEEGGSAMYKEAFLLPLLAEKIASSPQFAISQMATTAFAGE